MFRIEMLEAAEGDALWVEFGDGAEKNHLVIDAGRKETYRTLADRILALGRPVDLWVMTHIDDDHLFGAVPLLADRRVVKGTFRDVWYNGYTHLDQKATGTPQSDLLGPENGEIFAALLAKGGHPWNAAFGGGTVVVPEDGELPVLELSGMKLTLLSPTWNELGKLKTFWEKELEHIQPGNAEEALELFSDRRNLQSDLLGGMIDVEDLLGHEYRSDDRPPNGSSIAFLAEYGGRAALFTGDAHSPVLENSLRRLLAQRGLKQLRLDAFKVSHHGSKNNTSVELLELLDCRRFLISTNGKRHNHPDPETLARIVHHNRLAGEPTELYFNFRSPQGAIWDDRELKESWNFRTTYPPDGRILEL